MQSMGLCAGVVSGQPIIADGGGDEAAWAGCQIRFEMVLQHGGDGG